MSNKEILEKAIQKAIDGGWSDYSTAPQFPIQIVSDKGRIFLDRENEMWNVWQIIFNHEFAKALWGEGYPREDSSKYGFEEYYDSFNGADYDWQIHLQRMVISEDPIKYLGENI